MRVSVDHGRCVASGSCTLVAPAVFRLTDGTLEVLETEPSEGQHQPAEDAAAMCPTGAITIEG